VASSPQTPKNPASQSPTREQTQEQFRQHLRQADKFIKEQQFAQAKQELVEAKKLDPTNPFIVAFEERIAMFEKGIHLKSSPVAKPLPERLDVPVQPEPVEVAEVPIDREAIEHKIREKVEEEYKIRFTKELRRAEEHAAKILDEERAKLEAQRHALNIKYEQQLDEIRQRLESEYRAKLADEISHAEDRLKKQFESKLHMMEEELKTQLTLSHATEIREMEGKLRHEHEALLERERASFQEREQTMKEQFERRLQDELKSSEVVVREQTQHQQHEEQNRQRNQMMEELQAALQKEREASKIEYDALKKKMEESYLAEQQKLTGEHQRRLEEELHTMRQRETEEFERKCAAVRQNVEQELRASYDQQISAERRRLHEEADAMTETEKKRLHDEYSAKLDQQESNIKSMRATLQRDMESSFLKRMEQIADQYDYKMELLGAKIPETQEGKLELYRARMRDCYLDGMPTVEGAKNIMALKELLELSFDDHLSVESDVRLDLYVEHVERMIMGNEVDIKKPNSLDELKLQYRITSEEAARLEPYILSSFQRVAVKGKILLVDDDLLLLQSLEDILNDYGFQVIPSDNVTQALEILTNTAVDLILSDIKFKDEELDGFQFFLNVQSQPHLRKIPFIFMSSLRDGVIIRSGVQLGADDYLTKPVEPDLLIAVVEGKLKRYRNFQGN
jgi:CheY-like chemotaxis protein